MVSGENELVESIPLVQLSSTDIVQSWGLGETVWYSVL